MQKKQIVVEETAKEKHQKRRCGGQIEKIAVYEGTRKVTSYYRCHRCEETSYYLSHFLKKADGSQLVLDLGVPRYED